MLKASSNAPPSHQVRIQQTLLLSMSRVQTNDKSTQSNDFLECRGDEMASQYFAHLQQLAKDLHTAFGD